MSARDWPENWPEIEDLMMILRAHPEGCRRGDFADLDARRKKGVVAVMGFGWIHIRRRLLEDGIAELHADGSLILTQESEPAEPAEPEPEPEPPADILTIDQAVGLVKIALQHLRLSAADIERGLRFARLAAGDGEPEQSIAPVVEAPATPPSAEDDDIPTD